MLRKIALAFIAVVTLSGLVGCNSDSVWHNENVLKSSVAVTGFTLADNPKVLNNLDSVFFAIDLDKALIYNADSLPKGTDIRKLVVNITTDGSSTCELSFKNLNGKDTVVNYLTNSTDSINFSDGPVKLHLVSVDQEYSRDYYIHVNVHKIDPDSMAWGQALRRNLPSTFGVPAHQKTVKKGEKLFCLTNSGSNYCLASAGHPEGLWNMASVSFPFTPSLTSFSSTDDALYILATDGSLYKSADEGKNWTATGETWTHIIGGYGANLLGVRSQGGVYYHASYPAIGTSAAVAANFPVSNTSQLYIYSNKWEASPQAIMLGGKTASGKTESHTWAFDGKTWADLTERAPAAASDWTLVPYYECKVDTVTWRSDKADVLIAIGGIKENGTLQPDVYVSKDLGFKWRKASSNMQLPKYIGSRYNAQAFVFSLTNKEKTQRGLSATSEWELFEAPELPAGWVVASPSPLRRHSAGTRAIAPAKEWQTPYIYMFGGYNEAGSLYNTVWRGVINRLEFRPIN